MQWMDKEEALQAFAFESEDELEDFVLEFELEAKINDAGEITAVQAWDLREPLFELHARRVGYRPDDPKAMAQALLEHQERENRELDEHRARRRKLRTRVARRPVRKKNGD